MPSPNTLQIRQTPAGAGKHLTNANHWLKFNWAGTVSNWDAIGAKVRVLGTVGGQAVWQLPEVSGASHLQNDIRPNFGLGDAPLTPTTVGSQYTDPVVPGTFYRFYRLSGE
jgi:hypothetical protein